MERKDASKIIRLLEEIRDLLIPMSDAYRPAYEERQETALLLQKVVSSPERKKMYALMDGTRTQAEIAREVGVTQPAVSQFISALVENELVGFIRIGAFKKPVSKYDITTGRKIGGEGG